MAAVVVLAFAHMLVLVPVPMVTRGHQRPQMVVALVEGVADMPPEQSIDCPLSCCDDKAKGHQ